ncbi:MAG: hypothetical protein R2873_21855 [Caldilineaceae bacterium]
MKKLWFLFLLVAALTVLLAVNVAAQTDSEGEDTPPRAFAAIDLSAGFPLDPLLISLNGGGDIDVSDWGDECVGFVTELPTVTLNWTGESDFVEAFFYSDHDPVLVVETPSGEFLCNDDANEAILDPVVQIDDPEQGRYNIWVGSYDEGQLLPGLLVLTTRHEVNIGTFAWQPDHPSFSTRKPRRGARGERRRAAPSRCRRRRSGGCCVHGLGKRRRRHHPHRHRERHSPRFRCQHTGRFCNGFIHTLPDYVVNVTEEPVHLRFSLRATATPPWWWKTPAARSTATMITNQART